MSIVSFIVRSICSAEPHCSALHVVRESLDSCKEQRSRPVRFSRAFGWATGRMKSHPVPKF